MALQTSGAISLNQIHVEAGGSSGTTASINDSDIRALISKGSGVTMSFSEWYGATAATSFPAGTSYAALYNSPTNPYNTESAVVGYTYEDDIWREPNTGIDLRLVKTSSGFEVRISLGHDPSSYHYGYMSDSNYNETTLANATEALMFELTSETVDALKIDWSVTPVIDEQGPAYADFEVRSNETPSATYNASDNVWQSLSNGQSMGVRFYTYTHTVDPYSNGDNSAEVVADIFVNIWARKTGKIDTLMATYKLKLEPSNIAIAY